MISFTIFPRITRPIHGPINSQHSFMMLYEKINSQESPLRIGSLVQPYLTFNKEPTHQREAWRITHQGSYNLQRPLFSPNSSYSPLSCNSLSRALMLWFQLWNGNQWHLWSLWLHHTRLYCEIHKKRMGIHSGGGATWGGTPFSPSCAFRFTFSAISHNIFAFKCWMKYAIFIL